MGKTKSQAATKRGSRQREETSGEATRAPEPQSETTIAPPQSQVGGSAARPQSTTATLPDNAPDPAIDESQTNEASMEAAVDQDAQAAQVANAVTQEGDSARAIEPEPGQWPVVRTDESEFDEHANIGLQLMQGELATLREDIRSYRILVISGIAIAFTVPIGTMQTINADTFAHDYAWKCAYFGTLAILWILGFALLVLSSLLSLKEAKKREKVLRTRQVGVINAVWNRELDEALEKLHECVNSTSKLREDILDARRFAVWALPVLYASVVFVFLFPLYFEWKHGPARIPEDKTAAPPLQNNVPPDSNSSLPKSPPDIQDGSESQPPPRVSPDAGQQVPATPSQPPTS